MPQDEHGSEAPAHENGAWAIIHDGFSALFLTVSTSRSKLLRSWILIPAGITAMLATCFGVDLIFRKVQVSFPASVACLVLLFLGLLACEAVLGSHKTRKIVNVINVPADWSLRWIGLFFTPSFVLLPLSPSIGIVEVFKIIAVFVIGFVVMMLLAAYLTRFLQLILGSSKRSETQRAEELRRDSADIPLTQALDEHDRHSRSSSTLNRSNGNSFDLHGPSTNASSETLPLGNGDIPQPPPRLQIQDHHYAQDKRAASNQDSPPPSIHARLHAQDPLPPSRAERWAAQLTAHFDEATMAALLLFVGIPIYYGVGYAMPAHLTINALCYFAALAIPSTWRQYLHPVLVSSLFTVLVIWPLAEIKGQSITEALTEYKTGAKYLYLWEKNIPIPTGTAAVVSDHARNDLLPGAGDLFGTVLDASIVSLALPMFQYRRELRTHFVAIVVPNVLISIASLFTYPPLCFAIGISAKRSLAFASRSLTLALATPATKNLGGDSYTVAALAIASGILGVLIGQRLMAWMRIPEDDYVTRGVTLGLNSSAIGTALLLRSDPRAAALSSLSMTLFGTVTVLFTSIPPMAAIVRSLVGL